MRKLAARFGRWVAGELIEILWAVLLFVSALGAFYGGHPIYWAAFLCLLGLTLYMILRKKRTEAPAEGVPPQDHGGQKE